MKIKFVNKFNSYKMPLQFEEISQFFHVNCLVNLFVIFVYVNFNGKNEIFTDLCSWFFLSACAKQNCELTIYFEYTQIFLNAFNQFWTHSKYFVYVQYILYTFKYAKTFNTVNKWIKINLLLSLQLETPQP